jgi:DNA-binding GntR family transcriptional regulator
VREPARLTACHEALRRMEQNARDADRGSLVENGYAFHSSIVALAGHRRLSDMYRSVQQQLLLCMARNLGTRERYHESLVEHVARHRHLLELIEAGDPQAVLAELAVHGERSFSEH